MIRNTYPLNELDSREDPMLEARDHPEQRILRSFRFLVSDLVSDSGFATQNPTIS